MAQDWTRIEGMIIGHELDSQRTEETRDPHSDRMVPSLLQLGWPSMSPSAVVTMSASRYRPRDDSRSRPDRGAGRRTRHSLLQRATPVPTTCPREIRHWVRCGPRRRK